MKASAISASSFFRPVKWTESWSTGASLNGAACEGDVRDELARAGSMLVIFKFIWWPPTLLNVLEGALIIVLCVLVSSDGGELEDRNGAGILCIVCW